MNSSQIRQTFLDFFESKKHKIVPSAPIVVKDDPTLMFTNAGMNQFKDIFLGNQEAKYSRIADTQKCLRVSGKHNDLEEVGHDTYHHTMFEMLGNWSFGDYFKEEAIDWGWELLTDKFGIDKERLFVTVFGGDEKEGLSRDTEAYDFWKKHVPEERILFGSKKDNFWEMGDTGPCGPCSEIHVDLRDEEDRKKFAGKDLVNMSDPLVIEIWNLVFIEFNRQSNGQLVQLPAKHVDTGMGFERLCMALQHKKSNYDTDVFQEIIRAIAQRSGIAYGHDPKTEAAMRVVADHLRAVSFAICDGQMPSNVKAGYVIRRILRRAVRYGYTFLGMKDPFIFELVPVLAHQMENVFPELRKNMDFVMNAIRMEETAFLKTLATGIQRFNAYVEQSEVGSTKNEVRESVIDKSESPKQTPSVEVPKQTPAHQLISSPTIDGTFAFELFDTFGFPVDLTQLMAREIGWSVDMEGFARCMEEQKNRSRSAATVDTADWVIVKEDTGGQEFVGYDLLETEVRILRYRKIKNKDGEFYNLVFDKTPFYAESGGQVGDKGILISGTDQVEVLNTVKENDLIIHITANLPSYPEKPMIAMVDTRKRVEIANNHSATHLLHAALRKVLGTHVEQKGSLVDEEHLRFDFTHLEKMTHEQIEQVEKIVNQRIRMNIPIKEDRSVPIDKAKEMGAMALFGEKYGETVRVISFDPQFSVELCGGTHVPATGQIGMFKIISEGAIAAGIRRIEAVTAGKAEEFYYGKLHLIDQISELLKQPKDLLRSLKNTLEENQQLKKIAGEFEKIKQKEIKESLKKEVKTINGINCLFKKEDLSMDAMKNLGFELRTEVENLYIVLVSESEGKVNIMVALSDSLVKDKQMNAGQIIRELAKEVQGGGGGQPHIATAGGKEPAGIPGLLVKAAGFAR
jgi:alanyl-tRNA synthetase